MNKKILMLVLTSMMLLVGCSAEQYTDEQGNNSDLIGGCFVVIDEYTDNCTGDYFRTYITYDKDTKVMYYILDGSRRAGLCPMYDANGDVMVYEGEDK